MLTDRLLRTVLPLGLAALALAACGPDNVDPPLNAGPSATATGPGATGPSTARPGATATTPPAGGGGKGTFEQPYALKAAEGVTETHYPDHEQTRLRVTPVSVVKGDRDAVGKLGVGLMDGRTPWYVTAVYDHDGGGSDFGGFVHKLLLFGADTKRAYIGAASWGVPFSPCQEASDEDMRLEPGKSVSTCEIYLLPDGVQPVFLGFQGNREVTDPMVGPEVRPEVVWSAR
ncbi:hypothetical protein ABTY61_26095 [Kitasatospora sp. NPDC096128]|uniref:hypothetical protein n=1 Tax=Kitasatospora sp. NPDC096128 TaxID=3155547 RepID=UPI003325B4F5